MKEELQTLFNENERINKERTRSRLLSKFFMIENQARIIAIFDVEKYCFDDISNSVRHILGYEPNEMLGKNYERFLLYQQDVERGKEVIAGNVVHNIQVLEFVNCYRHKDGREIYLSWDVSFVEENKTICIAKYATVEQILKHQKLRHEKEKETQTHSFESQN